MRMSRRVFFSFHYQRDYWRVNQVRNSWVTKGRANSFLDAADWEKVKRNGDKSIKNWIDNQLKGTSVTAVLIGNQTANRKYVQYEIEQSYRLGKGIVGINIHQLKDQDSETEWFAGRNPFSEIIVEEGFIFDTMLSEVLPIYDWVDDDGFNNFESWIEKAAVDVGR